MRKDLIIYILIASSLSIGGYFYYQYRYIETLMLSEIIGHSDDPLVNILVNFGDFDTGLTRHDIEVPKEQKDYWLGRIKEVDTIGDHVQKEQASLELLSDMMEDPVLKKICTGVLQLGTSTAFGIIEIVL